jgi:hypothetical protein
MVQVIDSSQCAAVRFGEGEAIMIKVRLVPASPGEAAALNPQACAVGRRSGSIRAACAWARTRADQDHGELVAW